MILESVSPEFKSRLSHLLVFSILKVIIYSQVNSNQFYCYYREHFCTKLVYESLFHFYHRTQTTYINDLEFIISNEQISPFYHPVCFHINYVVFFLQILTVIPLQSAVRLIHAIAMLWYLHKPRGHPQVVLAGAGWMDWHTLWCLFKF
jgi:hypothetical protein